MDAETLRARLSTQSSTLPTRVAVPLLSRYELYDPSTFRRDVERVERAYAAEGFHGAAVEDIHWETDADGRLLDLDVTVREGQRTTVGTLWLSGCEEGSPQILSEHECEALRSRLGLTLRGPFTERAFTRDRELLREMLEDFGRVAAQVRSRATVDPETHEAHVMFVLDPGPESFFGRVRFVEGDGARPIHGDRLPSGYPLGPVRSALALNEGGPYSRTVIAAAQRRVFELGAFGIVRIIPRPSRCSAGVPGCGAPPTSPTGQRLREWVRVDLQVQLAPRAMFFQRFGVGLESDQLRSSARASWRFEWRNAFGGMRRLTGEVRPQLFFPSLLGSLAGRFDPGVAASIELRQPELRPRVSLAGGLQFDLGPDPFNPNRTSRAYGRPYAGLQFAWDAYGFGAVYLRAAAVNYYGQDAFFRSDPIYAAQYVSQTYYYAEATIGGDWRDNPIATRRGALVRGTFHGSGPVLSQVNPFAFVRGQLETRGFVPLSRNVSLAVRLNLGLAMGFGGGVGGWPVPQELRFYSGGANSNRGYPFNRVGPLATVPRQTCIATQPDGSSARVEECNRASVSGPLRIGTGDAPDNLSPDAQPDVNRLLAIGGLGLWEASFEARWYLGSLGLVGFVDLGNVAGWNIPERADIPRRPLEIQDSSPAPSVPPAGFRSVGDTIARILSDFHPSAGLGLRYVSPIGVLRLDAGLRLDDLRCETFTREVEAQRASAASAGAIDGAGFPAYFVVSRPPCNLFGLRFPGEVSIAIGEAY